jgi:hypothetical protein
MDMIKREKYEYTPKKGFVLTHFLTVANVKRSSEFYLRIFGGKVIRSGEPTIIQIANSWLVLKDYCSRFGNYLYIIRLEHIQPAPVSSSLLRLRFEFLDGMEMMVYVQL